ncbi:hypothetical protein JS756_01055 [Streptomyces actuosus]|uniref:AAA+ ATPase domain-containing protein n=1 Tax=Streptomyces actuosus TaxID=1885 RepID=A0ABS2VI17_STRAS|nr:hypothetical protein [Streptomyces actuosus]MBN0042719.1 hypothetical protein [Streptomyces actuosus]
MSSAPLPFSEENPFRDSTSVQLEGFGDTTQIGAGPPRPRVDVPGQTSAWFMSHVERYLRHDGPPQTRGRALALVGEFGLGKSHLAERATAALRAHMPAPPVWVIAQPSLDMDAVFRYRLMSPRDDYDAFVDFEQAITDYYADVTAELLEADSTGRLGPARDEFLRGLRERRLDPDKIARAFDVDEERIHRHLRQHLRGITDHRAFATALALLVNDLHQNEAMAWLSGDEPTAYLRERGVSAPIRGIQGVFDALSVFSLVYGQSGRPYALVLDELDKTTQWPALERALFSDAFEMLVQRYVNQGGLLVFCVRPELWGRLPLSLHERVLPLWLDSWARPETQSLISRHIHRGAEPPPPGDPYAPFTEDAVDEIVLQSDGVPRQILQICAGAWERAAAAGGRPAEIGVEAVREALRTAHQKRPMAEVAHRLENVLARRQWWHHLAPTGLKDVPHPAGAGEPRWIQVTRKAWIALLAVPSVLTRADVASAVSFASRVRDVLGPDDSEILVIVNGHACRKRRNAIAEATGVVPLVFDNPHFERMLLDSVDSLITRLRANQRNTVLTEMRDRLDGLATQQNTMLGRLEFVQRAVEHPRLSAPLPAPAGAEQRVPLPVREPFRRVQETLDRLLEDGVGQRPRLGAAATGEGQRLPLARRSAIARDDLEQMGALVHARRLVEAFREAIAHWWEGGTGRVGRGSDELFAICRSFEISVEVLPRIETVEGTPPVALRPGGRGGGSVETLLADVADEVLRLLRPEVSDGAYHG